MAHTYPVYLHVICIMTLSKVNCTHWIAFQTVKADSSHISMLSFLHLTLKLYLSVLSCQRVLYFSCQRYNVKFSHSGSFSYKHSSKVSAFSHSKASRPLKTYHLGSSIFWLVHSAWASTALWPMLLSKKHNLILSGFQRRFGAPRVFSTLLFSDSS